jgi:hypothetical protein
MELLETFGLPPDYRGFADPEKNWWPLVRFLHKLVTWFLRNGSRSFSVFPVFRPRLKHLRYNAKALYELLRATKPLEFKSTHENFRVAAPMYWWCYFDSSKRHFGRLDPLTNAIAAHRNRTKFAMALTTNRAYFCVSMERFTRDSIGVEPKCKRSKKKQVETNDLDFSRFSGFLGLDPGMVNYVGTCYLGVAGASDLKRNYTLKTVKFKQFVCKERAIHRRREKLIGRHEPQLLEYRKIFKNTSSKCCESYGATLAFTAYCLRHHESLHLAYS